MMNVMISGARPKGVSSEDIERVLIHVFQTIRKTVRGSVSVAFVSDQEMRTLNRRWRKKNRTTDVLSFAPPALPTIRTGEHHWGDIVVSPVTVRGEARRRSIEFREEVLRVIAHGMLHLFGFDHATESDEAEMFLLQERTVERATHDV